MDKKDEAETYYLVSLALRGLDKLAYTMAGESSRATDIIPRVCRVLIAKDVGSAAKVISESDVEGDTFTELLLCTSDADRVAFLRNKTENGTKSLPGDIWINTDTDQAKIKKLNTLNMVESIYPG